MKSCAAIIARVLPVALLLAFLTASLAAQPPTYKSTEVHPNNTITFRYYDPTATKVELILEDTPATLPMQKASTGIWIITTPPLKPEIYGYRFAVDGKTHHDPLNSATRYANNLVVVPGDTPQPWDPTDVPHGEITPHTYTTRVVLGLPQNQSEFIVYTPPGYNPKAKPYPVLYLLHVWGDRPDSWNRFAQANIIFDNLIAQGKAKPMIVVMPLGYGDMKFAEDYNVWSDTTAIDQNLTLFTQSLLTEVMPQVQALYNVSQNRNERAIIGASMGGLESLTIGLNHTAQFAWVGGISSAVQSLDYVQQLKSFDPAIANLRLLWIACGTGDELIEPNRHLAAWIKSKGTPITIEEPTGLHSYIVWRESLIHFASLLFKP
jgi:enterochelin esterase-like enzyme